MYLCLLGELFRGKAGGWAMLGELFRACWRSGRVYVLPAPSTPPVVGGFARHEVVAQRVAGVLDPHVVQFPQSGGGEVSTRGGVTPKVQITSEKSAEYGLLWAKWSAIWTQRCLA